MIEIHSHILPGFDDGAQSRDEALEMAHQAAQQGITDIIATPHHGNGVYMAPKELVVQAVEEMNRVFESYELPIKLHTGQEIRVYDGLIDDWENDKLLTLAKSRYILLELPHSHVPGYFDEMVYELSIRDLIPVIAHPERNKEIIESPELLEGWIENGVLCQVTSHSLIGLFGRKIQKATIQLCKSRLNHFVSSDAHNCKERAFALREAYRMVDRSLGRGIMNRYKENSRRLLSNEDALSDEPVRAKRKLLFW
ncbi:tyrosine-protein phosphatase [Paenibacillus kobensis]|uniref:tyrosine-protein phosphatase n=1 Tax=Paenibacillus kobensis TaxID=59841 RepID=UPI000FDBEC7E|nr:CpsB/CapC family capsule biosynthesis tyrosine phosphatase [Paenibacillus kobensis]